MQGMLRGDPSSRSGDDGGQGGSGISPTMVMQAMSALSRDVPVHNGGVDAGMIALQKLASNIERGGDTGGLDSLLGGMDPQTLVQITKVIQGANKDGGLDKMISSINPELLNQMVSGVVGGSAGGDDGFTKALNQLTHGVIHTEKSLRPVAPGFPLSPAAPAKPMLDSILGGVQSLLTVFVLSKVLPLMFNPALALQFVDPKIMVANPPVLPATFREADPNKPEYFHPYGQYGDYGYEPMGMKGFGCASGSCAPWWWSWSHKNKQFAPFSKSSPAMD